ncbi:MAG: tetratricopeptide repeat protein, partial [Bacteroidetes bacterium]|nr:tetratricopeptide repeat protein [Bacteroidota bacterium]
MWEFIKYKTRKHGGTEISSPGIIFSVPLCLRVKSKRLPQSLLLSLLILLTSAYKLHSQNTYTEDSLRFAQLFNQNAQLFYQTYADSAVKGFKEMATQAREADQFFWEARAYQGVGLSLNILGLPSEAMKYTFLALEYYEKQQLKRYLGQVYDNIGQIYFNLDDFPKAIEYFQKSLEIALEKESWYEIAASYNNLSQVYQKQSDLPGAKSALLKVESALKKSADTTSYGILYNNLAEVYVEEGKYDSAQHYLNLAYEFIIQKQQTG